jgi:hypothetical protein
VAGALLPSDIQGDIMLKRIIKLGIVIMGIIMLSILATTDETIPSVLLAQAQGVTVVEISRSNSSVEKNRPMIVYIDDVRAGTLMPGRRLTTTVNNGRHTVQAKVVNEISEYLYFTADYKTLHITANIIEEEERGLIFSKKIPVIQLTLLDEN